MEMSRVKNHIKNVAIVGAGGNIGKHITNALINGGRHVVTAITRIESTSKLPDGVGVRFVSYDNHTSLVQALRGQDALIITLGIMAPQDQQMKLIEAAAEADVPWIFPNEYTNDTANERMTREALIAGTKNQARQLIEKLGRSSWIAVSTGFWYEWSLALPAAFGFDLENRVVTLFDEGLARVTVSTLPQVGRTMLHLLSLKIRPEGDNDTTLCLDHYRNDWVYTSSFTISQKEMLSSILRVTNSNLDEWTVNNEPTQYRYRKALIALKGGDRMGFVRAMYTRVFFPDGGGNVEDMLSNKLFELPEESLDEATRRAFGRAEELRSVLASYSAMHTKTRLER